jgi:hypothetical protein
VADIPRLPPKSPPSPPPTASEPSLAFQYHLRPFSAFNPKARTPASPNTPIVPPAAKQDKPQHNPAASYRTYSCFFFHCKNKHTKNRIESFKVRVDFNVIKMLKIEQTIAATQQPQTKSNKKQQHQQRTCV